MRIYIFRILTMIHLNTFSRVCPHSRGNNATEWDSVRIWRKDLSSTGIIPVEMPDFRTRHPGQVTTVENLSREARTRVRAVVCLYRRPANWPPRLYHYRMWLMWRLTQPLRLVIIIALGNRASPSILNRVPSERNALSTESTWPPGPNAPPSLSLSLSRSLFLCPVSSQICGHVGLFIQWTEERSAGFGYCFSGCREREKKKEERVPG